MAIWGTTFVSTKVLLMSGLTPASIFLLRFSIAYAGLTLTCLVRNGKQKRAAAKQGVSWMCRSWRDELLMVVAGMTGGSFYFLTENTALTMAMASNVSLIVCLAPLITAIFALFIKQGERATLRLWVGSLIAFTGVAFVAQGSESGGTTTNALLGNLLALAAATLWAVYQHVVKPLATRYGTLTLTRKVFGYGLLTILPFVLCEPAEHWEVITRPVVWGNLLFLGLIASLLCYATWNAVVEKLGSIVSANYIYLNPLVTCVAAYFILGERFTPAMTVGGLAILAGLYLVVAPKRRNQSKAERCQAVVFYRLPNASSFTSLRQNSPVMTFSALSDLPMSGGYAIVPFDISENSPIVFVEPDEKQELSLQEAKENAFSATNDDDEAQRAAYARSYAAVHSRLQRGELEKVVLSRRLQVELHAHKAEKADPIETLIERGKNLFFRACATRPECFVAFWWTEQTGAWLVATPEPILKKQENCWETVALAGTLQWYENEKPVWSEKNREEQAIVARFVADALHGVATDVETSATQPFRTGRIQHLCTNFRFHLPENASTLPLLQRLHPTPAVCGVPREDALKAIKEDESSPRRYYAGFSGPFLLEGETQLFVSLRCMEMSLQQATLYAGGGIMPQSREQEEWEETQRKLTTMRELL